MGAPKLLDTGVTYNEEVFCREYVKNFGDATKSYQAAYPNTEPKNAHGMAGRVLKRERVMKRVKEIQQDAFEAACITPEKIGLKLNELAFGEDIPHNVQLKALDLLQKQAGLQVQKKVVDVQNEINICIE